MKGILERYVSRSVVANRQMVFFHVLLVEAVMKSECLLRLLGKKILATTCFAFIIVPQAVFATEIVGPFNFTNDTGITATDLHVVFAGTGGTLAPPVTITQAPPAAPAPATSAAGNQVDLDWQQPAVAHGQSVAFTVGSGFSPIEPADTWWTEYGNNISGTAAIWPVAIKPAVTSNFGSVQSDSMHSALDIPAAQDTPVRAVVDSTIVAVSGNYIIASDGTDLYAYAHIYKTVGANPQRFTQADVGTALVRGTDFAFVGGAARPSGGSFDHLHFEHAPGVGADASIKNPDGSYKSAAGIVAISDPARKNPLFLYDVKDPDATDGKNAPEIGPIFWQPKANNVAGFTEYGNQQTSPSVRRGTFVNGSLDLIQQITDDQGDIQPAGGNTSKDAIDNTINVVNEIISNPYKVSYEVKGTGVVAGKNIAERTLVEFNSTHAVHEAQRPTVYDSRRSLDVPGAHPAYNYAYVLTNTDGAAPNAANAWNTMAKTGAGGQADGTGAADTANNAQAKFPDGIYEVHGYGYDIGAGDAAANKTSISYETRVNNWKQTAIPGHGAGVSNIQRADDVFKKDGPEKTTSVIIDQFNFNAETGYSEPIYVTGDAYLADVAYNWYLFDHRLNWEQDDLLTNYLLSGVTELSDATGFIDESFITDSLSLYDLAGFGVFDIVIDYDADMVFSWTLDGVGGFDLIPTPNTLALMLIALLFALNNVAKKGIRRGVDRA